MPLSGAHIACGYSNGILGSGLASAVWSQTMASAGTTTQAAPKSNAPNLTMGGTVMQVFEVRASLDCYVSIGATPDAVAGPRIFVPANVTRTLLCVPGDMLAWTAA